MKIKAFVKAFVKGAEAMLVIWSVGVAAGAGFRAGEKIDDWLDETYYRIIKTRKIKGLQKKLQKLSKKEQLTEDDKKQQDDILAEIFAWQSIDVSELSVLGTSIKGGFNINYKKEEK